MGRLPAHGNLPFNYRSTMSANISSYRPDFFYGNHDLKAGWVYSQAGVSRFWDSRSSCNGDTTGPGMKTPNLCSGNYTLTFRGGVPFQFGALNNPVTPYNEDHHTSFFFKDQWTIRRRITANLGLRFDQDNGLVPPQCREAGEWPGYPAECFPKIQMAIWRALAPRLHLSYDITGDGKTVIKGGWARFNHMRDVQPEIDQMNRNVFTTTNFTWHDNNRNNAYDPGEVNLDPNGPDFVSITGTTAEIPNLELKQPKADEFSLSLEREVMANMGIRLTGIYSHDFNTYLIAGVQRPYEAYNIPIRNPDPGPDGRVGTADDTGQFITYYDYAASGRSPELADDRGQRRIGDRPDVQELRDCGVEAAVEPVAVQRLVLVHLDARAIRHEPAGGHAQCGDLQRAGPPRVDGPAVGRRICSRRASRDRRFTKRGAANRRRARCSSPAGVRFPTSSSTWNPSAPSR